MVVKINHMGKRFEGQNSEVTQQQNRYLVLKTIRELQVTSRVSIAEITGLKQATITNIVKDLFDLGYLKETGLIEGNNGRRVKGIGLNTDRMRYFVVRLTGEYFALGMYDLYANCIEVIKEFWEESIDFESKLEYIYKAVSGFVEKLQEGQDVFGIGVVVQDGAYPIEKGDSDKKAENYAQYIQSFFADKMNIPVYVDNISNMSGFFEWNRLSARNEEVHLMVCLMIGYSIDCAVIHEGKAILRRAGKANHFGHVSIDYNGPECECGNHGCIKNYISIEAIKKRIKKLKCFYPNSKLTGDENIRDIIQAFYDEDVLAKVVYSEVAEKLGVILTNLINQYCPDEIILGDEIPTSEAFEKMIHFYTAMHLPEHRYKRVAIKIFNEERKTQNDAGMIGMCMYTINESLKSLEFH